MIYAVNTGLCWSPADWTFQPWAWTFCHLHIDPIFQAMRAATNQTLRTEHRFERKMLLFLHVMHLQTEYASRERLPRASAQDLMGVEQPALTTAAQLQSDKMDYGQ